MAVRRRPRASQLPRRRALRRLPAPGRVLSRSPIPRPPAAPVPITASPRRRWLWWALLLLQGATLTQLWLLHQKQSQLEAMFACTERRFNNPGTFGGTRCFDPANPQFTPRPLAESAPIQP